MKSFARIQLRLYLEGKPSVGWDRIKAMVNKWLDAEEIATLATQNNLSFE